MKKVVSTFLVFVCLVGVTTLHAQIPDAGFETWSGITPTGWTTDNVSGFDTAIVKTTDAHSGTYAAEGVANSTPGAVIAPGLNSFFIWTTRSTTFSGYYKYAPVGGDTLFIAAVFAKNSNAIGTAILRTTTAAATYTQFSIPFTYVAAGVPDSGAIVVGISPASGSSSVHVGSMFKIDDLSFSGATGVVAAVNQTPGSYALHQNFPNPFNPTTVIGYDIPVSGYVSLKVFDLLGRERVSLVNGDQSAGSHQVTFDASKLASGTYFYQLQAGSYTETKKLLLVK